MKEILRIQRKIKIHQVRFQGDRAQAKTLANQPSPRTKKSRFQRRPTTARDNIPEIASPWPEFKNGCPCQQHEQYQCKTSASGWLYPVGIDTKFSSAKRKTVSTRPPIQPKPFLQIPLNPRKFPPVAKFVQICAQYFPRSRSRAVRLAAFEDRQP